MGIRSRCNSPSPALLSTTTLSDALSLATAALSPWLSADRVRTLPRELRILSNTLTRLRSALSSASASGSSLFDRVSAADAKTALIELRDIAARARAASAARPRIKLDWRGREKHTHLFFTAGTGTALTSITVPSSSQQSSNRVSIPDIPFPLEERRRVEAVANRLDTLIQVALWKGRHTIVDHQPRAHRTTSCVPVTNPVSTGRLAHRRGASAFRSRGGRNGRVFSNGDLPDDAHSNFLSPSSSLSTASPDPKCMIDHTPPWSFSLIESPITPLRSRSFHSVEDCQSVLAMWQGHRVSVKIIRHDEQRFVNEANYLHSLGLCSNIPSLLGAHWEHAPAKKKFGKNRNVSTGYLVMEVNNGISLDKLVRQSKLSDTVTRIRVLERIVAALIFAQKLNPLITHQDLHPGNILLVPSPSLISADVNLTSPLGLDTFPISASSMSLSSPAKSPFIRTTTDSTTITTDTSIQKTSSQSTLLDASSVAAAPPNPCNTIPQTAFKNISSTEPNELFDTSPLFRLPKKCNDPPVVSECIGFGNNTGTSVHCEQKLREVPLQHDRSKIQQMASNGTGSSAPVIAPTMQSHQGDTSASTSTIATTASPPIRSASQSSQASFILDGDHTHGTSFHPMNSASSTAFTVKVMDFPLVAESEGLRQKMTWELNDALAGYCAPEKVSQKMVERLKARREKERERRSRLARSSKGRNDPPVKNTRVEIETNTSENNQRGEQYLSKDLRILSAKSTSRVKGETEGETDVYVASTSRSSSTSHRHARDSETYALFGDDHLVETTEPNIDSSGAVGGSLADAFDENVLMMTGGGTIAQQKRHSHNRRTNYLEANSSSKGEAHKNICRRQQTIVLHDSKAGANGYKIDHENEDDNQIRAQNIGKIDVWSIGWLLYYMCTGQHPSRDAWVRQTAIEERILREVPLECRDIIKMCVEPNALRRASLRELKRLIDSKLQKLMFIKGVSMLETEPEEAFVYLDKAVGIQTHVSVKRQVQAGAKENWTDCSKSVEGIGLNEKTRAGLASLPLIVVRRVEWEATGRHLKLSDLEMQQIRRSLVKGKWNKNDVTDGWSARRYLEEYVADGISSAQSALGWLYRWGAGGLKKDISKAVELWEVSIERGSDAEACNGLGLLYHHGREDFPADGKRGRQYYEMAVEQGYTAAAVNLGVMLHDGAGCVEANGEAAQRLYEMASRDGDAIAANNLGLLLQHGCAGVEPNAALARAAFESAIARNERHHACRNLGELLWDGGKGVERDRHVALDYFVMAINRGDVSSRAVAISRLKRLVASAHREPQLDAGEQRFLDRAQRMLLEIESVYQQ